MSKSFDSDHLGMTLWLKLLRAVVCSRKHPKKWIFGFSNVQNFFLANKLNNLHPTCTNDGFHPRGQQRSPSTRRSVLGDKIAAGILAQTAGGTLTLLPWLVKNPNNSKQPKRFCFLFCLISVNWCHIKKHGVAFVGPKGCSWIHWKGWTS